ncbi:NACHT domain-containing NTPase [Saccharothrix sp. HUAS TT1]|uniref:NACHT domain-containing protein n=1 Tax=unclassified Saccharothrix TaxID=2593673 RepID=UPI00345B73A9
MRRSFSYGDAVKLLDGDTALVKLLDHASAAAVLVTGGIDLLDARAEVVRLGKRVLSSVRSRVTGLHRTDRTRLLEAAHGVVVMTAFFEALDEVGLPFQLRFSGGEQLALAGADRPGSKRKPDLVRALLGTEIPLPSAEQPPDAVTDELGHFYAIKVGVLIDFVSGFEAWYGLTEAERDDFATRTASDVPHRAVAHYETHYRQLAVDCPEFSVWTAGIEHAATRATVRTALADLRSLLGQLVGSQPPDDRRRALSVSHRAVLNRPIVDGDVPPGLVLPSLAQAYVPPRFKVVSANRSDDVSQEGWWDQQPVRTDLDDYLAGYLTSSFATTAPLVVLGQPGAGKSLLTKVLAGQLPAEDFLPIRVALRDVPVDATLQEQVEDAITRATGERLDWPDLARAAAPAVPVVLLDGFDELLQATGASRSDYLVRVREFQHREADQGRAVIVVVTSRTAVANRARFAGATVVLKLEPFGDAQVRHWLDVWNRANPGAVLEPEVALRFEDLVGQPLLLFMLALYNADGDALRSEGVRLARARLYERLLTGFARREVAKNLQGALDHEVERAVEEELIRLSVVAFAMFNRGVQWIDETDLDADLNALLPTGPRGDRRLRLSSAQLAVGRFFFVHAARAAHDGRTLRTYEFLHATFGEYLVARLVHRVSREAVARDRAARSPYSRQRADTGWLEPVLSFAPMSSRAPVISFLRELFDDTPAADRSAMHELFTDLVGVAQFRAPGAEHPDYAPRALPVARRIAAYTANLVILAVLVRGWFAASDLDGVERNRTAWRGLTLLWQSQLDGEEWDSVTEVLEVRPPPADVSAEVVVVLREDRRPAPVDLAWLLRTDPAEMPYRYQVVSDHLHEIRRWGTFRASWRDGLVLHALEPLMDWVGPSMNVVVPHRGRLVSLAHLLLVVLTADDPDERVAAYTTALSDQSLRGVGLIGNYGRLFFGALAGDEVATEQLLDQAVRIGLSSAAHQPLLVGCAMRLVEITRGGNHNAAELLARVEGSHIAR